MELKFWKNAYFRLGLILGSALISLLIVLPRIPIVIQNDYINIDTAVGGYYLNFSNGRRIIDLREFKKGLDLNGGVRIVLGADMSDIAFEERAVVLENARLVIQRRVELLGITYSNITTSSTNDGFRITVELPRTAALAEAVDIVGKTAQLQFTYLKDEYEWDESKSRDYFMDRDVWENSKLTGADIKNAEVVFSEDPQGKPGVQIIFTDEGRLKFEELAKNNIGRPVALFSSDSNTPLFMPVVSEEFAEGAGINPTISGDFDIETANSLSIQIKSGALPVTVDIIEQTAIEPTLGREAINKSLQAGFLGIGLIWLFMLVVYRRLGVIANISLIVHSLIVLAVIKVVPITLTLPGITGFILSMVFAVDMNILIFERIKEEIKWNRPKNLAIKFGFERARTSTRDAGLMMLLIAGILYYFGNSPVKGFALALIIGTLISLIISSFVARSFVEVFGISKESRYRKLFSWRKK